MQHCPPCPRFFAFRRVLVIAAALGIVALSIACGADDPAPQTGTIREFRDAESFAYVAAGTYQQGCSNGDKFCGFSEGRRRATISRPFWIQQTEATLGRWKAAAGDALFNRGQFDCFSMDCPVVSVGWYAVLGYANHLSKRAGLAACYTLTGCTDPENGRRDGRHDGCTNAAFSGPTVCNGYRLPTSAEWEYAARAGTTTATYGGHMDSDDCPLLSGGPGIPAGTPMTEIAWIFCIIGGWSYGVQPTARLRPNPWGLYDVLGNVSEWVWDAGELDPYAAGDAVDPVGPTGDKPVFRRVTRGGSFASDSATKVRASSRGSGDTLEGFDSVGFRLVRGAW